MIELQHQRKNYWTVKLDWAPISMTETNTKSNVIQTQWEQSDLVKPYVIDLQYQTLRKHVKSSDDMRNRKRDGMKLRPNKK